MLFMPNLRQVWFAKLLIEWYCVDCIFMEQGVFKVVRGENTGPQMVRDQQKLGKHRDSGLQMFNHAASTETLVQLNL